MHVAFIHGSVASGKYTIAKLVSERLGLPLFHNHLAVDAAAALFEFGTPEFVAMREEIWISGFEKAARSGRSFVFTFAPEGTVAPDFVERAVQVVRNHGGEMHFVQLTCADDEIERRIGDESRGAFGKMRSAHQYRRLREQGAFAYPPLPPAEVVVATDAMTAGEAAARVVTALAANFPTAPDP